MTEQEKHNFIRKRQDLFWFIPTQKKPGISDECLVETILNFGTMDDVTDLIRLLGIKTTANIFSRTINRSGRRRNNYHELTLNYFTLFFKRYAPEHFE